MFTRRRILSGAAGLGAVTIIGDRAFSQTYPDKAIRIIVPGSPGGRPTSWRG